MSLRVGLGLRFSGQHQGRVVEPLVFPFVVQENTTFVGTLSTTIPGAEWFIASEWSPEFPPEFGPYSLDGALFQIDSETGELSFLAPPDFEAPLDGDADNLYELYVGYYVPATGRYYYRRVLVLVTNLVEGVTTPVDTNSAANEIADNADDNDPVGLTVFAECLDGGTITYSIESQTVADTFRVHHTTGVVTLHDSANLAGEGGQTHTLTIRATSTTSEYAEEDFDIDILATVSFPTILHRWSPSIQYANSGSSTTLNDLAGSSHGTLYQRDTSHWVDSGGLRAIQFAEQAGSGVTCVKLPNGASVGGKSQASLSLWYRPSSAVANNSGLYVECTTSAGFTRFGLYIDDSSVTPKVVGVCRDTQTGSSFIALSSNQPALNTWHHVLLTYDANTNNMELFIDGVSRGTNTTSKGALSSGTPGSPIAIGALMTSDTTGNSPPALIDDVMIFDGIVDADGLAYLVAQGRGCAMP